MKKYWFFLIGAVILIISITLWAYLKMVNPGSFSEQISSGSGSTIGGSVSGVFLLIRAWGLWQRLMSILWTIFTVLIGLFILCGLGICLRLG